MILDSTLRKLQIVLTAAKTTNDMPVIVDYVDMTATTTIGGTTLSNSNGITAVDILAAPVASTQRKINSISIYNRDTAAKTLQILFIDNVTSYQIVDVTLQVDDVLGYTDTRGWYVIDVNGNTKTTPLSAMTSAQLAAILTDETGTGSAVFATSPTLVTPILGVASATSLTTSSTIGIGAPPLTYSACRIGGAALTLTGSTIQSGVSLNVIIDSTATASAVGFSSIVSTAAAAFTLPQFFHFNATNLVVGAGSSVTNQYGFKVEDLSSATNNYAIHTGVTSGANKYNIYIAGNANSVSAGNWRFGGTTAPVATVDITGTLATTSTIGMGAAANEAFGILNTVGLTGTSQQSIRISNTISSSATTQAQGIVVIQSTEAAAFTLPLYQGVRVAALTKGAGSTITSISSYTADDQTATGVTTIYGVENKITSGSGKWGYYGSGNANNAFAGNTRFGGVTAPVATVDVTGSIAASTTMRTGSYTVATLPVGATGDRAYVTDATAPTWNGALTGGGTVIVPVFKNATVWVSA